MICRVVDEHTGFLLRVIISASNDWIKFAGMLRFFIHLYRRRGHLTKVPATTTKTKQNNKNEIEYIRNVTENTVQET